MLSRKDYVMLSNRIAFAIDQHAAHVVECAALSTFIKGLVEDLARDNPRFDAERFLYACGRRS
jgi:hypothetical protein